MVSTKQKSVIKPKALKPGDRVGLVSPASRPLSAAVVARAQRTIAEMGLHPVLGAHVLDVHGFMAGSDHDRLRDLNGFIHDESIAAIYCLTGGYGSLHLLPHISYEALAKAPKLLIGSDEATCLINAVHARTTLVTMHAPNLDAIKTRETFERVKSALTSTQHLPALLAPGAGKDPFAAEQDFYCPVEGTVEGRLVGGNLTALASLWGTEFQPDCRERILFLEDINEQNGILDRWFTTLYLSGDLQYCSAAMFGSFVGCGPKDNATMMSIVDLFAERLVYLKKTTCFGMPFGQQKQTYPLPVGVMGRLHAAEGKLEFLEEALTR